MNNPGLTVQEDVKSILAKEPWFAQRRVRVICQDSEELRFLVDKELSQVEGAVAVIAVDSIQNNHPSSEVDFSVIVTENVAANRSQSGFATAQETAFAIGQTLDGKNYRWFDIQNSVVGEGILQAVVKLRCMVGFSD